MSISQDLLNILRCPYCVSGPTRKPGDNPGQLELVNDEWLVCQEADCGRKYPIKEDIPVMLVDEGDKWVETAVADLPAPGKLVEPGSIQSAPPSVPVQASQGPDPRLLLLLSGLLVLAVGGLFWFSRRGGDNNS